MVRTPGSHPGNTSSILVETTIGELALASSLLFCKISEFLGLIDKNVWQANHHIPTKLAASKGATLH